ncbi:tellurite resistance TerB family protein, partial [Escherichia coli]|nr:tellurite resistance TerB family protein [Escherichia coli]
IEQVLRNQPALSAFTSEIIEPEERKVLEEIAGVLGLRLENHQ